MMVAIVLLLELGTSVGKLSLLFRFRPHSFLLSSWLLEDTFSLEKLSDIFPQKKILADHLSPFYMVESVHDST